MQFFFLGGEGRGKGAWSSRNELEFLFLFAEHVYFIPPPNFLQIQRKTVWAVLVLDDVLYISVSKSKELKLIDQAYQESSIKLISIKSRQINFDVLDQHVCWFIKQRQKTQFMWTSRFSNWDLRFGENITFGFFISLRS